MLKIYLCSIRIDKNFSVFLISNKINSFSCRELFEALTYLRMTKVSRKGLKARARETGRTRKRKFSAPIKSAFYRITVNILSIKKMRWSICDEGGTSSSSSSEDDKLPILPETSFGELSTIEESHLEHETESDSSGSSTSNYFSTFMNESITSISNSGSDGQSDTQSNLEHTENNESQHEPNVSTSSCSNASVVTADAVSSPRCLISSESDLNRSFGSSHHVTVN